MITAVWRSRSNKSVNLSLIWCFVEKSILVNMQKWMSSMNVKSYHFFISTSRLPFIYSMFHLPPALLVCTESFRRTLDVRNNSFIDKRIISWPQLSPSLMTDSTDFTISSALWLVAVSNASHVPKGSHTIVTNVVRQAVQHVWSKRTTEWQHKAASQGQTKWLI